MVAGLFIRVANIVTTIAVGLQCARCAAIIINNIHTHHIAVTEAAVVDTRHRELCDIARQLYAVFAVKFAAVLVIQIVRTSGKHHAKS